MDKCFKFNTIIIVSLFLIFFRWPFQKLNLKYIDFENYLKHFL